MGSAGRPKAGYLETTAVRLVAATARLVVATVAMRKAHWAAETVVDPVVGPAEARTVPSPEGREAGSVEVMAEETKAGSMADLEEIVATVD